jgi:hypothetical protein
MLCREIHLLRVHAILKRKIRTDEEQNIDILIISIYCIRAKERGWQYTKRILPPFVIPECNIMLVNVWRYIVRYPDGVIRYEQAGFMLGSYDNRTIKKHILLGWQMIQVANLGLMKFLSTLPGFASLPKLKVGESAHSHLVLMVEQSRQAAVRMGIAGSTVAPVVSYIHGVYVVEKSRKRPKTTLNHVFQALLYFDTS